MLLQETIYNDANFVLLHDEIPPQITEDYFNLLVNDFMAKYLQSKKYEERISKHRNPVVIMNEVLNDLYAYHLKIQSRKEINYNYQEEGTNEYANVRIARIMEEDKSINSLFEAMIEYCNVREKRLEIISVHYAEFIAIDQLISEFRLLVFNEEKKSKNCTELDRKKDLLYFEALMEKNKLIAVFENIEVNSPPPVEIKISKGMIGEKFVQDNFNVCIQLMHSLKKKIGLLSDTGKLHYLKQLNLPAPSFPDFGTDEPDSLAMAQAFYQSQLYYYDFVNEYVQYLSDRIDQKGVSSVSFNLARNHNQYDLAISFAGEDRAIAEMIADKLKSLGFHIFYDKYEQANLWGKDLYEDLNDIYSKKAKFCLMIISKNYAQKHWTNHERKAAQAKAFSQNEEYILPLRLDDTEIPGINTTIGYVDYNITGLDGTITLLRQKIGK